MFLSPEFNAVGESVMALIDAAILAAVVQARELDPQIQLPSTEWPWAESCRWACDALDRMATSTSPERESPYDTRHGKLAQLKHILLF